MRLSGKKGFTLIELLIVVVIIGILAAIAIPKFSNTKEKAYLTAMKSDLRNLATAEESYFSDNTAYVAGTASNLNGTVTPIAGLNFTPSSGVSITITQVAAAGANPAGWQATSTHNQTAKTCAVQAGGGFPATVGTITLDTDGAPVCEK